MEEKKKLSSTYFDTVAPTLPYTGTRLHYTLVCKTFVIYYILISLFDLFNLSARSVAEILPETSVCCNTKRKRCEGKKYTVEVFDCCNKIVTLSSKYCKIKQILVDGFLCEARCCTNVFRYICIYFLVDRIAAAIRQVSFNGTGPLVSTFRSREYQFAMCSREPMCVTACSPGIPLGSLIFSSRILFQRMFHKRSCNSFFSWLVKLIGCCGGKKERMLQFISIGIVLYCVVEKFSTISQQAVD